MLDKLNIMIVDDEPDNIFILKRAVTRNIKNADICIKDFLSWEECKTSLDGDPKWPDIILLDRMLPGIDGLQISEYIRSNPETEHIPIIIQSGKVGATNHIEAIKAGAYYYLTKPFDSSSLVNILYATIREVRTRNRITDLLKTASEADQDRYDISSLDDALTITASLAKLTPQPLKTAIALYELVINAIEHGSLSLDSEKKNALMVESNYETELSALFQNSAKNNKAITINVERSKDKITFIIRNEGEPFPWKNYLKYSSERIATPTGRGIARANSYCSSLEFTEGGRESRCSVALA